MKEEFELLKSAAWKNIKLTCLLTAQFAFEALASSVTQITSLECSLDNSKSDLFVLNAEK